MADDEDVTHQPRGSRWSIALSAGVAIGAVGVAAYAYSIRIPTGGRSADSTTEPSALLLTSLVLTVLAAVTTLAVGWWALTGKDARPYAATLLAGMVVITGYRYLGEGSVRAAAALSGPGARPAVPLAQLAWPLLVAAALVLLVGAVWSRTGSATSVVRAYLSPLTVLGVVLAVGVSGVAARAWEHQQPRPSIVAATPIPPLPTAVGTDVAYTVTAGNAFNVVPAGSGFIVWDGDGVQAYDGATGAKRWRFGAEVLPQNCALHDVRSTGTTEQSVVIAECVRPEPYPSGSYRQKRSILTGIDALTGSVRWFDDETNLSLGYGAGQSDSIAVVTRDTDIGAIDPRTGTLRWMASGAQAQCGGRGDLVADDVVIVPCDRGTVVRVLDGDSGSPRKIALQPYLPKDGLRELLTLAADGDTLLISARSDGAATSSGRRPTEFATLAIDVPSGTVVAVPSVTGASQRDPKPGPLVQLGTSGQRGDPWVDVYVVAPRKLVRPLGVGWPDTYAGAGRLWARVGEDMVTAAANDDEGRFLAMVGSDGAVRRQELPCVGRHSRFDSGAGVLGVPGATLVLCPPPADRVRGWAVVGLR